MSCGRRLVSHLPPRRPSATRQRGRSPGETSRSSGSEERQHERECHAQDQPEEDPPSPSLPSFLEQDLGIRLWWVPLGTVENDRFWL